MTTVTPASREYRLRYEVEANNRLGAIMAAGSRLRAGVVVNGIATAEPFAPGWWAVEMDVYELPPPDESEAERAAEWYHRMGSL